MRTLARLLAGLPWVALLAAPVAAQDTLRLRSVGDERAVRRNRTGEECRVRLVDTRSGFERFALYREGWDADWVVLSACSTAAPDGSFGGVRREPAPAHLLARLGLDLPEQPCICPPTLLATEMYCRLFRHVCEDGSDLWQLRKLG